MQERLTQEVGQAGAASIVRCRRRPRSRTASARLCWPWSSRRPAAGGVPDDSYERAMSDGERQLESRASHRRRSMSKAKPSSGEEKKEKKNKKEKLFYD